MKKFFAFLGIMILLAAILFLVFSYKTSPDKVKRPGSTRNTSIYSI